MSEKINPYGDELHETLDGHGSDISSQRLDALDEASLHFIASLGRPSIALDLGGGFGAHTLRMARKGATVYMVDLADTAAASFSEAVQAGSIRKDSVTLIKKNFLDLADTDIPYDIDVVYSQRAIHYVRYDDAKNTLKFLFTHMASGGKVFLSAAGYETEYGKTYPDRDKTVTDRFSFVADDMKEKHGIRQKIVTYKEEELAQLLADAGYTNIKTTTSAFGNIKATCLKP